MDSLLSLTHSLHFTHFTHNQPLRVLLSGGGGRWRADMASGGKGFGTERARLAQGGYRGEGFGTERARLAQGGFLGQFYKGNPFKRDF